MNPIRKFTAHTFALLATLSVFSATAADLPNIHVIATGGTIAGAQASAQDYGYQSGAYDINTLINAVPNLGKLANITIVPVKPAEAETHKKLVEGAVLAGWAKRCGSECAAEWNNTVGKTLGLRAPTP